MAINKLTDVQRNNLYTDEVWQKRLLGMIAIEREEMVFQNLGVEKMIPVNQGTKTFTARRYNRLPVNLVNQLLAEGVAPTALKVEGQKVSGTASQYGALIQVTDVTEDIHFDNIKEIYQPELARHAAEVMERVVLDSFSEASEKFVNNRADKEALIATDVLDFVTLRKVDLTRVVNLRKGHPKAGGRSLVVVANEVMNDLLDDDDLEKKLLATGQENAPIKNGSLRSYVAYNLVIQESLMCPKETVTFDDVTTAKCYTSYLFGFEPYWTLKLKDLSWHNVPFTATTGNELAQVASVGYKMWFGAKVVDPLAIYAIKSRSNYDVVDTTSSDTFARPASQA